VRSPNSVWILALILVLPASGLAENDTLLLVGTNPDMGGYAVAGHDIYAFVPTIDSIKVADYSVPSVLLPVTSYPVNLCMDIEIRDSLAYYVGDSLYIRDISNPLEPQVVGSYVLSWGQYAFRVHLFDSLALVIHNTPPEICLLRIIDVSDPTDPQILDEPLCGSMYTKMDAWKKDDYVYWVDYALRPDTWEEVGRIMVLDVTNPAEPVPLVVDTCLPSAPYAIWIEGSYAYVGLSTYNPDHSGLMVLDVSDPYNIDSVGFYETPYTVHNVHIKDNLAYVSALGLYVLDISDPTNPILLTHYSTPAACRDVFVDEPYVLVAEGSSLSVFEASFLQPGDVNWDRQVNIGDVVYLINYLFVSGPEPSNSSLADVNCDCQIDIADTVYLIDYLFLGGSPPQSGGC
jgi:hypothetical protein